MTYRETIMQNEYIRCHVTQKADMRFTDGALPHAMGVTNVQIMRASQDPTMAPEGRGWTYSHAAMLGYWQDKLMVQYLSGPVSEHEKDSAAFLICSPDGVHFEPPIEIFPTLEVNAALYDGPKQYMLTQDKVRCIIHHRMAFYHTANDKMLAMTFYGICPTGMVVPGNGYGVGRVVREIHKDFSFGAIHFLRFNPAGQYNQSNTKNFPFYTESEDQGFVQACDELLANRLATQQWWEEECRDESGFFTLKDGEAPSMYTLPDGRVMAIFKNALTTLSSDRGEHWEETRHSYTLETSTGKVWGEKTPDGRYALIYNPSTDTAHRWPLAIVSGDNGQDFYDMLSILPEIPPCRYQGRLKNFGAQYMRGIAEYNPKPDEQAMYLTYSNNKEDIWLSRISVPVRGVEKEDIDICMKTTTWEELANTWNLTIPAWGGMTLLNGALTMWDMDHYHRAIAERNFKAGALIKLSCALEIDSVADPYAFTVGIQNSMGEEPVTVVFHADGIAYTRLFGSEVKLFSYACNDLIQMTFVMDCVKNIVEIFAQVNGETVKRSCHFDHSVWNVSRIQFRTKYALYHQDLETYPKWGNIGNLPNGDIKAMPTAARIRALRVETVAEA